VSSHTQTYTRGMRTLVEGTKKKGKRNVAVDITHSLTVITHTHTHTLTHAHHTHTLSFITHSSRHYTQPHCHHARTHARTHAHAHHTDRQTGRQTDTHDLSLSFIKPSAIKEKRIHAPFTSHTTLPPPNNGKKTKQEK